MFFKWFWTLLFALGNILVEKLSPDFFKISIPTSIAAVTDPMSPYIQIATKELPIFSYFKIDTLAAFKIASVAFTSVTKLFVSIRPKQFKLLDIFFVFISLFFFVIDWFCSVVLLFFSKENSLLAKEFFLSSVFIFFS